MSIQAEQEVIAAMVNHPFLAKECDLTPDEFQNDTFSDVYRVMQQLVAQRGQFDLVTLSDAMKTGPFGHVVGDTLAQIVEVSSGSKAMFRDYCGIVRKDYRLKQAATIAQSLLYAIQEDKDLSAADAAISQLMQLGSVGRKYEWTMREALHNAVQMVETAFNAEGLVGIDTGLDQLNEITGGWHPTDLIIVGARPAMGKTALMLNFAHSADCASGIISSEQGNEQVGLRMLSIQGRLNAQVLRTAKLQEDEWPKLTAAHMALKDRQILINDEPSINIVSLCRQAREWKYRHNMGVLFVDYVQRIKGSARGQNKLEQVTEVVGALKSLAKELNIPVIALAQVNRSVDSRPDKRPNMGDLSDASEIEKEADSVIMLYRDEAYREDTPHKGIAELIFEKNRHGPTGTVRCAWLGQYLKFEELAAPRYAEQYGGAS
ncbi:MULTISPECIES: replicative DNA helicase [unclassified Marinobacter]|uniref:replicative DNA helicase n=1 Tax=unclassified Marinobacter TaxID=83889 RepID=UPI0019297E7F|nr:MULTISPECIES: DnaB-like helicase C-terminal domain-containing protein [unclassified Marinobacter]MBL3825133.1 AAA family ATPase [Marinobacter sp. MC3]MBL3893663.1 AAA family ATPase [Marinobacter sp. MW3]